MNRSLLFFTSAVAAGALTGFLISDFPKIVSQLPKPVAEVLAKIAPSTPLAMAVQPASASTALGRFINSTTAALDQARPDRQVASVGLLLKEPVIIVRDGIHLPSGTAVALLKNEGRFIRIRHDESEFSIPRSAVTAGAPRKN